MKQRQRGNQGEKMGRMERLAGKMNGSRGITFHRQPNCNEIFPRMKRVIRPRRVVENSVTELGGSCAASVFSRRDVRPFHLSDAKSAETWLLKKSTLSRNNGMSKSRCVADFHGKVFCF